MKNEPTPLGPYMTAADAVIGTAVLCVLGAVVGAWIDSKVHTSPMMAFLLTFVGMVGGLWRMIAKVTQGDTTNEPISRDDEVGANTPEGAAAAKSEGSEGEDEEEIEEESAEEED